MNVVPVTRRVDDQHTRDDLVFAYGGLSHESAEEGNRMVVSGNRFGCGLRLAVWGGGPRVHWVGGLHESAGSGDLLSGSGDAVPRLLDEVPPYGDEVPDGGDHVPDTSDSLSIRGDTVSHHADELPGHCDELPVGADAMSRVHDEVSGD